jgi:ubiquinone/menaquinone biosynthesis C-methylase UbiE
MDPSNILDIGSYRHFILGLLSHYEVTTLDIRERKSNLVNENIVTCDAKALLFADNSFDSVLSLEALPHFGLCRYGDEFDLDADIKAFNEMIRVLPEDI